MKKAKVEEIDNLKHMDKEEKVAVREGKKKVKKEAEKVENSTTIEVESKEEIKKENEEKKEEEKKDEGFADTGFGIDVFAQH